MADDGYMKALELQRRNFEAQFGSLESLGYEDKSKSTETNHTDSNDDSDEFGGFSDNTSTTASESSEDESDNATNSKFVHGKPGAKEFNKNSSVTVVKLSETMPAPPVSKAEVRMARSGRAPTMKEIAEKDKQKPAAKKISSKEDQENLDNDLKLQRLLSESHILSNSMAHSGADLTLQTIDFEDPTGKARRRAIDSRIRQLASTNSATGGLPKTLEKMPMSMRKGMIRKRDSRISKYEEEAKNAGIVLSKVKKGHVRDLVSSKGSTLVSDRLGTGTKTKNTKRDKGLKISSIGRSTRNGLIISQEEIDRIGGKGKFGKKMGKKHRR
ncbi:hypothetical protein PGUG_05397 [Meyerozyma guilliermondii ATCC 6260]|uniref:Protein FAF1 n=1 Tax=Meyerozyma guilliermondii (strain ATCC 6260 / CBS 566 / DSM 6381 / JCM 1539 / NBRC 10279 / NRRL Y-324) TaxID=294746 RepID=A5DQ46_PICGU|nr:uncharacterized protein PGUG_05397 [Meyerozyma guilliermondii ATCC 6260]EDK41299.2 hypothetical protein PGUG_05397 [Meyerozyma guilliermondii ATCC 6260]